MSRPPNLRQLLAFAISALTCGVIAMVMLTVGQAGVRRVEEEIGTSLMLLADQMQDKLDRALFERYREMGTAARLFHTLAIADQPDGVQAWLDELRKTYPDYAWIGFADRNGKVVRATGGLLQGVDVSRRPWFRAGLKDVSVGDVHEALILAKLLRRRPEEVPRFLDVSAPVVDAKGDTIGVLGAYLDWSWAEEVRDSLFGSSPNGRSEQVLVLTRGGSVLLGPPELTGKTLALRSVREAMAGANRFATEVWPDGRRYVTGYARSDGYRNFSGLGWIVLVRQDADVALAPAKRLQQQILLWSLALAALAALAAWLLAGRIASPVLRLAISADAVRRGDEVRIPDVCDYSEAAALSKSLGTLVSELKLRQQALEDLNQSLEAQVAQRTNELAMRNMALTLAREEAEKATAAKSRFLAAASHDLRQPLHAMTLFARALSRRVVGDEPTRLVEQLETSLASLKEMFDALLNVSRLDAGLIQPNIASVPVQELLQRISGDFRTEAEGRGLKFRLRSVEAVVSTDAVLLETMLRNLVSNALKFTRSGGVLLAARQRGGKLLLDVFDTGPGIASERLGRIFEEFERSNIHATGPNDGLGLGLSIVRRYARLLGIEVKVSSREGHGTRFSLLIPAASSLEPQAARVANEKADGADRSLRGARIVLIDDDPQIVAGMERELADRGCCALSFGTAAEAEAALMAGLKLDAAIVDFNLGNGRTGPSLLDQVERSRGRRIPALILTGGTDAATLAAVMVTRRPWLTKPADPDAIAAALTGLLTEAPAS